MEKSKGKRSHRRVYLWGGIVLVLLVAGAYVINLRSNRQSPTNTRQTEKVTSVTVVDTVQASGTLNAFQAASLNWKTSGAIKSINVKIGDKVHKGDVLAVLDSASIPQSVISAQADLIPAQQALEDLQQSDTARAQALVDLNTTTDEYNAALNSRRSLDGLIQLAKSEYQWRGTRQIVKTTYYKGYADSAMIATADNNVALAKAKLDDAQKSYDRIQNGANQADLAAAQARVDSAQAALNTTSIIAPFDGDVIAVYNQINDLVDTSTLAVIVANRKTYTVDAKVDETDITKLGTGQPVEVKLDALPDLKLSGVVESVSLFGQTESGIVKYDVFVSIQSQDVALPLGATVNLTIQIGEPATALAVPITAVYSDDQGDYVLLSKGAGLQQRVDVQSGDIVGSLVAVTGELKEGDSVVLAQTSATTTTGTGNGPRQGGFFGP